MYLYPDLALDAGHKERDFDIKNDAYLFRLGSRIDP